MQKMNPEVKKLWCEELRSGKHTQGKGYLHRPDGSKCCLGVLCELSGLGKWVTRDDTFKPDLELMYVTETDKDIFSLPDEVEVWSAITQQQQVELQHMNDTGKTFEQIAQHIEENY